jgi:hypothetical protein
VAHCALTAALSLLVLATPQASAFPGAAELGNVELCRTDACRELLSPAPPLRERAGPNERRVRRVRATQREGAEAAVAAAAARERDRLEPAYAAKSEAERFELAVARREGVAEEEARARAARAGALAFSTATEDLELRRAEEKAYQVRQAERRRAVAVATERVAGQQPERESPQP